MACVCLCPEARHGLELEPVPPPFSSLCVFCVSSVLNLTLTSRGPSLTLRPPSRPLRTTPETGSITSRVSSVQRGVRPRVWRGSRQESTAQICSLSLVTKEFFFVFIFRSFPIVAFWTLQSKPVCLAIILCVSDHFHG